MLLNKVAILGKTTHIFTCLDKIRNDIEQLNEKLDTFMAAKEGSSSKDKGENYDDSSYLFLLKFHPLVGPKQWLLLWSYILCNLPGFVLILYYVFVVAGPYCFFKTF